MMTDLDLNPSPGNNELWVILDHFSPRLLLSSSMKEE